MNLLTSWQDILQMWHKIQKSNCRWKRDHRGYQQKFLIGQFLKYLELVNQPFQLFTRIEACYFAQLALLGTFLVLKVFFFFFHKLRFPYYQKTLEENRLNGRCQFVYPYLLPILRMLEVRYMENLFWNN